MLINVHETPMKLPLGVANKLVEILAMQMTLVAGFM